MHDIKRPDAARTCHECSLNDVCVQHTYMLLLQIDDMVSFANHQEFMFVSACFDRLFNKKTCADMRLLSVSKPLINLNFALID